MHERHDDRATPWTRWASTSSGWSLPARCWRAAVASGSSSSRATYARGIRPARIRGVRTRARAGRPGCSSSRRRAWRRWSAGRGSALDIRFAKPHRRDPLLARRFIELHRALETTSWRLECETLLMEWLSAAAIPPSASRAAGPRAAIRRFGRARELLCDEIARNVTLDELAGAAGYQPAPAVAPVPVRRMACRRTASSSRVESVPPAGCSSAVCRSPRLHSRRDSSTRATSTATFARRSG